MNTGIAAIREVASKLSQEAAAALADLVADVLKLLHPNCSGRRQPIAVWKASAARIIEGVDAEARKHDRSRTKTVEIILRERLQAESAS